MGSAIYDLSGKAAVVTGGAKGIGFASAAQLRSLGADVLIADKNADAAASAVERLRAGEGSGRVESTVTNVAKADEVEAMVTSAVEQFGKVDILVNNAGIFPFCPIDQLTPEFIERIFSINVYGTMMATTQVAKTMIAAGTGGVIINITSRDAFQPFLGGLGAYGATKGAILAFTRHCALEFAPHKIRVCGVAPGSVATEGTMEGVLGMPEEAIAEITERSMARLPLGAPAMAEEIASVVGFLASPGASQITGATVIADGGMLLL